jgi:hypothetical protein
MTDTITLPRTAAEKLVKLVALPENIDKFWKDNDYAALAALAALVTALAEPDAKREPATDEQVHKWYWDNNLWGLRHAEFRYGWRAAERFHGIRKEDT